MKTQTILALIILALSQNCHGIEDTNVIAAGVWSEPIGDNNGHSLRGRLLMCGYPDHRGSPANGLDVGIYVELQEYSDSIGESLHIYCDFGKKLKCELSDSAGKAPTPVGTGYGGGIPSPSWISLPPFSISRLRANVYAGGRLKDGSLGLWFAGAGNWTIKANDTNTYFLSGTLTIDPPITSDFNQTQIWHGVLKLPKMKILK